MIDLRGGIAALSICLGIALINDLPRPVKDNQVKYCPIDYRAVVKQFHLQPDGKLIEKKSVQWVKGYGPCALMDRYEWT